MQSAPSLQIIAVRLQGGDGHEHITDLQWQSASSAGVTRIEAVVAWLRQDPAHEAWVQAGQERVAVRVLTPIGGPSHLRSHNDGQWGQHLLALPRF